MLKSLTIVAVLSRLELHWRWRRTVFPTGGESPVAGGCWAREGRRGSMKRKVPRERNMGL